MAVAHKHTPAACSNAVISTKRKTCRRSVLSPAPRACFNQQLSSSLLFLAGKQQATWYMLYLEATCVPTGPTARGGRRHERMNDQFIFGCRCIDRSITAPRAESSAGCCSAAPAPASSQSQSQSQQHAAWTSSSPSPRRPQSAAAGTRRCRTGCRPCMHIHTDARRSQRPAFFLRENNLFAHMPARVLASHVVYLYMKMSLFPPRCRPHRKQASR
jgi:hypothetical protein